MSNYLVSDTDLTDIADAIRAKGDTEAQLEFPDDFVDAINDISGGESHEQPDGYVKFIDYDGTVLHTYTKSEFSELSAMPSNPTHTGLISQGWNWTLQEVKNHHSNYPKSNIIVGQTYITDDGKTRIYITLDENNYDFTLRLSFTGTITIEWGDGQTTSSSTTSQNLFTHIYDSADDYVIKISNTGGLYYLDGQTLTSPTYAMYGILTERYRALAIRAVEFGSNINIIRGGCFNYCSNLEYVTIPTIGIHHAGIGSASFQYCSSIKAVIIPNTTSETYFSIGSDAFHYCYNLQYISIPPSLNHYTDGICTDCQLLKDFTIPAPSGNSPNFKGLKNCRSLKSVVVPSGFTDSYYDFSLCYNLEYYEGNKQPVLENCYKIESVTLPNNITEIKGYAFSYTGIKEIEIPQTVTSIGNYAFQCTEISSIELPSSVITIGSYAFNECKKLKSITIPNGVTQLKERTFYNCANLESATFSPSSQLTTISNHTFYACATLKNISLPSTLTSIGSYAFQYCGELQSINIPNSVTTIGSFAFAQCSSLRSAVLPDNATFTSIPNSVFSYCYDLMSVTIPDRITTIGQQAFQYCRNLSYVALPSSLKTINYAAFSYCQALKSIELPSTITTIGSSAFSVCPSLKNMYIKATTPPTLSSSDAIPNNTNLVIYVPYSADHSVLNAYQTAQNWSTHASKMQEYDFSST